MIEGLFSYKMNPRGDFYVLRCHVNTVFKKTHFPISGSVKYGNTFSRGKKMGFTFNFFKYTKSRYNCTKSWVLIE